MLRHCNVFRAYLFHQPNLFRLKLVNVRKINDIILVNGLNLDLDEYFKKICNYCRMYKTIELKEGSWT